MEFSDHLKIAINSLAANKFRTFLTTLGIIIGVMAVVALLGIGKAAQYSIESSFDSFGSNNIYIVPGKQDRDLGGPPTVTDSFTLTQVDAFYEHPKRYIDGFAGLSQATFKTQSEYEEKTALIIPYYGDYAEVFNVEVERGKLFDRKDAKNRSKVTVLGSEIAEDLFPQGIDPVGKELKIGNIKFTIIGITKSKGSNSFENPDTYVNVPYETFNQYLVNRDTLTTLAIQAPDQRLTELAKGEAIEIMRKVRDVGLNEDDDFTVRDAGEILDTIRQFTGTLTAFLSLVAAISLLVGGIGVMNIMFVSITERTKEIGLRKSIGARNSDILIQFLTESIVVTLLGGIMGIIVGILLSLLVSSLVNLDYRLELDPILLGVGFSIVIGLVFGIYPARKASKLSPIDALRYE